MSTSRKDSASKIIQATAAEIYQVILDPEALVCWLPPKNMKARIQRFEPWEGGAYQITLTYHHPEDQKKYGKSEGGDITSGKFLKLLPGLLVKQSVEFHSDDSAFSGIMTMTYELTPAENGTKLTITAENVPAGITRQDHLEGINATLENLAAYLKKT